MSIQSMPIEIAMPDIAYQTEAQTEGTLDKVGMGTIEMPLVIAVKDCEDQRLTTKIDAFVNLLSPSAKGIHMSRLYLALDELSYSDVLSYRSLVSLLETFTISQEELSDSAFVKVAFDYPIRRKALHSDKKGWRVYPVSIEGSLENGLLDIKLSVTVAYSSTCPCSAALARQLIQNAFTKKFHERTELSSEEVHSWLGSTAGVVATPHSQRSLAEIRVKLSSVVDSFPLVDLIDMVEGALKTPVQSVVKRVDEQEFALLNGQNLMFCEDAARRIHEVINSQNEYTDFRIEVTHLESLHAHDAVAVSTKGVLGGYQA